MVMRSADVRFAATKYCDTEFQYVGKDVGGVGGIGHLIGLTGQLGAVV